ncbi:MAG TPA: hypothetical protein VHF06_00870 [Pseudonocardiaceae bacterium]|jgi:hypothetical protein|nr:hypothetical protein [Pseudonocardiaceae bacterium]
MITPDTPNQPGDGPAGRSDFADTAADPRPAAGAAAAHSDAAFEPSPPVVELGSGWPAWVLRLALLITAGTSVGLLLGDGIAVVVVVFLFVVAVVTAELPGSPAPAVLIGAVAIAVTAVNGDPLRPEVLIEIPVLHLVHVLSSLSALVPLRAVIQPRALLRPARRFVTVQIAVFAVVALAEALPTGRNTTVVELAGLVAATGLVMLAIRVLTREK